MALSIDSKGYITTTFIEACKKADSQKIDIINGQMRIAAQRMLDRIARQYEYRKRKDQMITRAELRFERKL